MMFTVNEKTFTQEVLESKQPVLVHFWAPWCGLCRLILPSLLKLPSQWPGEIKVVSINADDNFKLANTYRLKTLPTLILFDRGQIVERIEDYQGREPLEKHLNQIIASLFAQSV